jgi:hypothetical protein
MNRIHRILIGLAVSALLPTAAFAQKITYDVGTADFSGLQTFAFRDNPDTPTTTEKTTAYDSPLVRERTHAAIAAQLEGRGLTRDDKHPDVYVSTRRTFKTEYAAYSWGPGYGYGWGLGGWGPWYGGGTSYTDERIIGTLIVDVEDAATGRLIWRGIGERHVHPLGSPEHRTKRVRQEVTKMFSKFPSDAVATSGHDVPRPTDR